MNESAKNTCKYVLFISILCCFFRHAHSQITTYTHPNRTANGTNAYYQALVHYVEHARIESSVIFFFIKEREKHFDTSIVNIGEVTVVLLDQEAMFKKARKRKPYKIRHMNYLKYDDDGYFYINIGEYDALLTKNKYTKKRGLSKKSRYILNLLIEGGMRVKFRYDCQSQTLILCGSLYSGI